MQYYTADRHVVQYILDVGGLIGEQKQWLVKFRASYILHVLGVPILQR